MKTTPLFKTLLSRALPLLAASALAVSAQTKKPVQIWVYNQAEAQYYQKMVDLYNQKTGAKFNAEFKAFGYSEMPDKLALAVKSGINMPDIVQFDEIFFSLYLKGEIPFLDLTDRIAKGPLRAGILPQRSALFTWNGRVYGVPQSTSTVVLWYREDLFRNLGVTHNELRTWEGFEAAAKRIKSDGRHMLALDWSYLPILVRQRGYDLYARDGEPLKDSAVIVDTWNRIRSWSRDGVGFMPGQGGIFSPQFFNTSVAANGVLAILGADWYGLDLLQNMDPQRAGNWRAMPLPVWTDSVSKGRRNVSAFSGQGLVIFKKSPHAEAAWKFVEWVMSDVDANVERYLQGNSFTPYQPAWTDLRLARPEPYFGGQVLSQLLMELSPNLPPPAQSPAHALIVNMLREQFFNSTMHDDAGDPAEAFSEMKKQLGTMGFGK
jgi:ABC-type glycerol-3-phosphate transport system substrate-binding protein